MYIYIYIYVYISSITFSYISVPFKFYLLKFIFHETLGKIAMWERLLVFIAMWER